MRPGLGIRPCRDLAAGNTDPTAGVDGVQTRAFETLVRSAARPQTEADEPEEEEADDEQAE